MNTTQNPNASETTLHGNLVRLGAQREIAVYSVDGTSWIAEFSCGRAQIYPAAAWLVANANDGAIGAIRSDLDKAQCDALPAEYAAQIVRLHQQAEPDLLSAFIAGAARLIANLRGLRSTSIRQAA